MFASGVTRNSTFLKWSPDHPPQYFEYEASFISTSAPLAHLAIVYGPVPASLPELNHFVRSPAPAAVTS